MTSAGAEQIGFVGLGRMGTPMARHLARAGHELTAFDIRPEVTERFCAEFGAKPARQLSDLAGCTVVITMLPTSRDVEAVLTGGEPGAGLALQLTEGSLVIDCSSSDPLATRQLGEKLAVRGIRTVDAPVAGGVVFAEDGTLDILVGGEEADIARAEPIVLAFGKAVRRCGDLGSAHAMKLLNNFVNAQALITYIEAMGVGAKFGIDREVMVAALLSATTGRNHPFEKKFINQVIPRKFASGMALGLISKDVGLAHALASRLDAWSPVLHLTAGLWAEAGRELGAGVDQTEVVRLWEKRLGVSLGGDGTGP
jgi:3-hydroxyisobutyrate dehydrogenase